MLESTENTYSPFAKRGDSQSELPVILHFLENTFFYRDLQIFFYHIHIRKKSLPHPKLYAVLW